MASVKGAAQPIEIVLDDVTREILEDIARAQALPHRDVMRAKLILLVAEGHCVTEVARRLEMRRRIVRKWAERFKRKGLLGLEDGKRSGRPPRFSPGGGDVRRQACVRAG